MPAPIANSPPKNLTGISRGGAGGSSPRQRRLDLRDAAARRIGRKPANQPGGDGDCRGAAGDDQNEPGEALLMGAADQRAAPAIGRGQRQPEHRDDQPRPGSGERRQQGQRQQAAITFARLSPATPPIHRRSGTPRRRRPVPRRQDCVRYPPISATTPLLSAAGQALLWRRSNFVQGARHDRTRGAPPDHRGNPPRHLGRPLPRRHRRVSRSSKPAATRSTPAAPPGSRSACCRAIWSMSPASRRS